MGAESAPQQVSLFYIKSKENPDMRITFTADELSTTPGSFSQVSVSADGVTEDELLESIDAQVAVSYYGEDTLLDSIGKDKAKEYFSLTEAE